MNIGFVTALYMPDKGGAEIFLDRLIRDLGSRGHLVSLVAPRRKGSDGALEYPVVRAPHPRSKRFFVANTFPSLIYSYIKNRFDILHCQGEYRAALAGYSLNKLFGVPYVCRATGGGFTTVAPYPKLQRKLEKALSNVSLMFAQGEFLKSQMIKYNVPEEKIITINNGVPINEISDYREYDCGIVDPYILYVGGLRPVKGYDIALKAFAGAVGHIDNNIRLVVAGNNQEKDKFDRLQDDLGIRDRVTYLGVCDRKRIASLFCNARIYLCPFKKSPFSNANLEAMAGSTPVIATTVGGNTEQIRDGIEGFLVPVDNYKAMSEKITEILNDTGLQNKLSYNAYKRAEYYSWENMVDSYENAYLKTLKQEVENNE